jgi:tRNA(Ile)-lysidine synthase
MLERVKQFILTNDLLSGKYNTILAAVSGGIDSCVLLDILYRLGTELKFKLVVIHFNHRVRGRASQVDEHFVKKLARSYGLKIITGTADSIPKRKNETELRELRIKFFQQMLQKNPRAILATGHSSTDQVETFLMRLAKGSRLRGLLGIKPRAGRLIHPMLKASRNDIIRYAKEWKLKFREDRTNYDTKIIRNRIRHKIIPCLQKNLSPDIEQALARSITDLTEHYKIYQQVLAEAIGRHTKNVKGVILLDRQGYLQYSIALRRGLLEYCISKVYPLNYNVSDQGFEQWDKFIQQAGSGRKKSFQHQEIALAEREYIHFGNKSSARPAHQFKLPLDGKAVLDDLGSLYFSRVSAAEVKFSPDRKIEFIDGACSGNDLQVRFWKRGDSFRPLGMHQVKKLSDFFIDLKLNRNAKQQVPLVCRGADIIWVAGYRLDDRYKITQKTKKYYRLELKTR